ncbi:hypothetical protein [Falsibacillus albus]|uniref:LysM domain-containing protein n=1 Tax=Falsibacillus albus TaxID=2478915 RepID=A0A3L7K7T8_9BACI|nr:hypothetical protein [Falsibacillus albus]RLQ98211.1 hypothetical protein D9X91_02145 [Falsibacillus albus]
MKKIIALFAVIILVYSVYYDINVGTLPTVSYASSSNPKNQDAAPPEDAGKKYEEVQVSSGQTVLTVVEKLHNGPIPVPIDQVIQDFSKLNKGIKPEAIQSGKTYKFPVYPQ